MAKLIWITGLSGSGKTVIAKEVYKRIKSEMINTVLIDGDDFRNIIGKEVGYSQEERFNYAIQISRMCKFLIEQDINVICATISLFKEVHKFNRDNVKNYFEIFIDCNMQELIRRDQKGIYSRALKGEIKDVVGIDIPFDKPENPELVIENSECNKLKEKAGKIIDRTGNH
jgi:adenylyl-sulfate kinase